MKMVASSHWLPSLLMCGCCLAIPTNSTPIFLENSSREEIRFPIVSLRNRSRNGLKNILSQWIVKSNETVVKHLFNFQIQKFDS